ncbi:pepsin-like aspartic protease [uncultured Desulfuromonas sp.]|uniref:pepsin-like aspartic protease n=1 Tax=uncultured Desulfuromonas sp. TaxID=181013 RepID=UPI002AAAA28F|nr:pepsin-like aspartic protease [uncultured Desulfuromonas sp.]
MGHERCNDRVSRKRNSSPPSSCDGIRLPLYKGPFQNNGASPWYLELPVGTPKEGTTPQRLKFSLDTGSNFVWVTSTLCGAQGCQHYGDKQFNYDDSSSFHWCSQQTIPVDFGPWGTMQVETGQDVLALDQQTATTSEIYLAEAYNGDQFAELDWDGGIGVPSSYSTELHATSRTFIRGIRRSLTQGANEKCADADFAFFQNLMNQGRVSPDQPFLAFDTDPQTKTGTVALGALDSAYQDSLEYLYLPFTVYPTITYVWASALKSLRVGEKTLATDMYFCLDTGSSQFKGDVGVMQEAFALTDGKQSNPLVTIELAQQGDDKPGTLVIPAEVYKVEIEAGDKSGQIISQFEPMAGVDKLILAGSVLLDYLYTVYEYEVASDADGRYRLTAKGMWLFNKKNGLKIIQNTQSQPARIFAGVAEGD